MEKDKDTFNLLKDYTMLWEDFNVYVYVKFFNYLSRKSNPHKEFHIQANS